MTKREKVIKGLKCCAYAQVECFCPEDCPYHEYDTEDQDCIVVLHNNALALLKAQEPRLMTWQEVIGAALECKPVYIEVLDGEDKEPGDDRWAMVTQYKDSITNGMIRAMSSYVTSEILFQEDYYKVWRCWDKEPTDEHRKVTPWERLN